MQTLEKKPVVSNQQASEKKTPGAYAGTAFFAALLLFLAINVGLSASSQNKRKIAEVIRQAQDEQVNKVAARHTWPWWLSKLYAEEPQAPDVVIFGSSLLGSAHASVDATYLMQLLDVLTHRKISFLEKQISDRVGHPVTVFSLGCPGEMVSDAYAISKSLIFEGKKKPKLVIATIAPRDFVDSTLPYPAATDHYKFFSNYTDLSKMDSAAYTDFFSRMGAELERLPLKNIGKKELSQFAEPAKSEMDQSGRFGIKPGDSLVPAGAVPKQVDNTKEYEERFKNPFSGNYNSEMRFFKEWLAEMKQNGIEVMVVCMPTTAANRNLLPASFWQDFRSKIAAVCKENNADWYDLSDCGLFQQSDYLDTVHLNAYGAIRLFPVLAERMTMFEPAKKALSK